MVLALEFGLFFKLVSRENSLMLEQGPIAAGKSWKVDVTVSVSAQSSQRTICERTPLTSELLTESTSAPKKTGKKTVQGANVSD